MTVLEEPQLETDEKEKNAFPALDKAFDFAARWLEKKKCKKLNIIFMAEATRKLSEENSGLLLNLNAATGDAKKLIRVLKFALGREPKALELAVILSELLEPAKDMGYDAEIYQSTSAPAGYISIASP